MAATSIKSSSFCWSAPGPLRHHTSQTKVQEMLQKQVQRTSGRWTGAERPMKTPFTILACIMLSLGSAFSTRAQTETPKPAPELKKLDYFVGTWTADGELKPGPLGAG